jgi:hypothetical protein
MPIKKDGMISTKEIFLGLKAIQVATLNKVKINKKMTSKLATHIIVFGILKRLSITYLTIAEKLQNNAIILLSATILLLFC